MIVLSACQTALGDTLGDGKEVLGLGFQMQRAGAKSTIASLWTVDDGGTQILMNEFYRVLAEEKLTKAETMRKAQIALIQNDQEVLSAIEKNVGSIRHLPSRFIRTDYTRPYYWSPFILIGNGL